MTTYTIYNIALALIVFPTSYWLAERRRRLHNLRIAARIALLMVCIVYPWDFFAIHMDAWTHPTDPGLRIYDVPVNDLIFTWLCTLLAASVLLAANRRRAGSQ